MNEKKIILIYLMMNDDGDAFTSFYIKKKYIKIEVPSVRDVPKRYFKMNQQKKIKVNRRD